MRKTYDDGSVEVYTKLLTDPPSCPHYAGDLTRHLGLLLLLKL